MTELARFDGNSKFPYLHRMGFIPDELYEVASESCGGKYTSPSNALCAKSVQSINYLIKDLNAMHILEPSCDAYPSLTLHKAASQDERKRLQQSPVSSVCRNATYVLADFWANDVHVRESLGIHKGTIPSWQGRSQASTGPRACFVATVLNSVQQCKKCYSQQRN